MIKSVTFAAAIMSLTVAATSALASDLGPSNYEQTWKVRAGEKRYRIDHAQLSPRENGIFAIDITGSIVPPTAHHLSDQFKSASSVSERAKAASGLADALFSTDGDLFGLVPGEVPIPVDEPSVAPYGTAMKYKRHVGGLRLEHVTLVISVNVNGEVDFISGVFVQPSPEMLAAARKEHIDKETAVDIVRSQYPPELPRHLRQLVEINGGKFADAEKVLTAESPYVVWKVSVPGAIFSVNASTGDVISRESTVHICF